MGTKNRQLAINTVLAAVYAGAVFLATDQSTKLGAAVAAGLPLLRLVIGWFGTLPMDKPAS